MLPPLLSNITPSFSLPPLEIKRFLLVLNFKFRQVLVPWCYWAASSINKIPELPGLPQPARAGKATLGRNVCYLGPSLHHTAEELSCSLQSFMLQRQWSWSEYMEVHPLGLLEAHVPFRSMETQTTSPCLRQQWIRPRFWLSWRSIKRALG